MSEFLKMGKKEYITTHLVPVPVSPGEAEGAGPQLREHRPQLAHHVLVAGAHSLVHHEPPHLEQLLLVLLRSECFVTYLLLVGSLEEHLEGHVVAHLFVFACNFISVILCQVCINHQKASTDRKC